MFLEQPPCFQTSDSPSMQAGVGKARDISVEESAVHHRRCEVTAVCGKFIHGPAERRTMGLLFPPVTSAASELHISASPQKAQRKTVVEIKLLQHVIIQE